MLSKEELLLEDYHYIKFKDISLDIWDKIYAKLITLGYTRGNNLECEKRRILKLYTSNLCFQWVSESCIQGREISISDILGDEAILNFPEEGSCEYKVKLDNFLCESGRTTEDEYTAKKLIAWNKSS